MDEIIAFIKKCLIFLAILIGLVVYVRSHYTTEDVLKYASKKKDENWSPRIEYYVGTFHWLRSDWKPAETAYNQMLTEYPTCQYAPKALLRLGDIYRERNEWDNARDAYRKYLDEFPQGKDKDLVEKKWEYVKFK